MLTSRSPARAHPLKRITLCCDGTWSRADQRDGIAPIPTNAVNLAIRVAKHDGHRPQVTWYGEGVGTGNLLDRATGGAFGSGLEANLHDAYRFLIANYELGDEIFLFGFSRGAFTVRSLAGMIRKCGILRRDAVAGYHETLVLYRSRMPCPDDSACARFRARHAIGGNSRTPVRFIGVWDTVGALGVPLVGCHAMQFHDTELSGSVASACQALAIDEERAPFRPTLWHYRPKPGQTVEQVWFAGAHRDVGGGNVDRALSDGPLQWLVERASAAGLRFDDVSCRAYPVVADALGMMHPSRVGWWNVVPAEPRVIGLSNALTGDVFTSECDPTQRLHESVLRRWDADRGYRPKNVAAYLRRVEA